jgi:DNA end-binding protein Ku
MARTIWKGAISFGLLHAPVSLYPASQEESVDFDWLQRDTLQPVGYKRVVKKTGEEIAKEDIVKGVRYEDHYVILSDEEIKAANVKSSQTIDIVGFTAAEEVSFLYFEKPYYLEPAKGGEKVYALLREALLKTNKIGIALIVLRNKQHLAALIPTEEAIILNTLRWAGEVRDTSGLSLPEKGLKEAAVKPAELNMAAQLIDSMSTSWDPAQYHDTFRDDIMALVKQKYDAGEAEQLIRVQPEAMEAMAGGGDLAELLRRSLQGAQPQTPPPEKKTTKAAKATKRASPPASKRATHRASKSVH